MNTKQLRQKILDLAIRGKLVPQDPNDKPASVLLEQIKAEKRQLVKEHKIKKEKAVLAMLDNESLLGLPGTWMWVRLGSVVNEIATGPFGTILHKSDYVNGGIPLINPQHIVDGTIMPSNKITVSQETAARLVSYRLSEMDIIIGRRGEMGRCAVVSGEQSGWLCGTGCFILRVNTKICSEYLAMLLRSEFVVAFLSKNSVGATMSNLNHTILSQTIIPLPPLAEQRRIVAAIDSAFAIIDEIERNKTDLQTAITAAKQKILSLAIQGKLVPQDPNDEPVAEFLRHTFNNDVIEVDEMPFAVPSNWAWSKFGSVCEIARGGSPRPIGDFITTADDGINWIKIGDTEQGGKYIYKTAEKIKPEGMSCSRFVQYGDFLLTNSMSFGRPYILKTDGCIHDGWLVIGKVEKVFNSDYLYHVLSSNWAYQSLSMVAMGSTVKNLKTETVKKMLLPIPPLAEQQRIIVAIDAIFEQLDNIAHSLT